MYNNDYTIMLKKELLSLLNKIGLSPAEMSVYIALLDGADSAAEIINLSNEKRPTVYYALNSLQKRGLVSKSGKEYGNKFQLEPVEKLEELVVRNIREQEKLLEQTKLLKDYYPQGKKSEKTLVSFFDSFESIKSVIFYTLYCKEKNIRSIVPGNNFCHEVG